MNSHFLQVPETIGAQLDTGFPLFQTFLNHFLIWNPWSHPFHLKLMEDISLLFHQGPDSIWFLGLEEVPGKNPSAAL